MVNILCCKVFVEVIRNSLAVSLNIGSGGDGCPRYVCCVCWGGGMNWTFYNEIVEKCDLCMKK